MTRIAFLGLLVLATGCAAEDTASDDEATESGPPEIDCSMETVPSFAEVTIFSKTCVDCHSSTKTGADRAGMGAELAPPTINYDTYDAAKAAAMTAVDELYEDERGAMPPEDSGLDPATASEKRELLVWAQCGTPE
jgi:hypothetical protein